MHAIFNMKVHDYNQELYDACSHGNLNQLKKIIHHTNINLMENHAITPLYMAAYNQHPHIIEFLIQNGADINTQNYWGITAFMISAEFGDIDSTRLFIKHGANLKLQNKNGQTTYDLCNTNLSLYIKMSENWSSLERFVDSRDYKNTLCLLQNGHLIKKLTLNIAESSTYQTAKPVNKDIIKIIKFYIKLRMLITKKSKFSSLLCDNTLDIIWSFYKNSF